MTLMVRTAVLSVVIAGSAPVATAQTYEVLQNPPAATGQTHEMRQNAPAPSPEKIALLERYFEAARLTAISDNMVDSMLAGAPMHRYSVSEQAALRSAVADAVKSTSPWLLSRFAEIYSRAFTVEEIEALVAFYESPVGRSLTAKTAGLTDEAARVMPEYQALVLQRFEEIFCGNVDCGRLTRAPATEIPVISGPR